MFSNFLSIVDMSKSNPLIVKSYDTYNDIFAEFSFKFSNENIKDGFHTQSFIVLLT